jgi:hypothetical protein
VRLVRQFLLKIVNRFSRVLFIYHDLRSHPDEVIVVTNRIHYSPDFSRIKKDNEPFSPWNLQSIALDSLYYKQLEHAQLIGNGVIVDNRGRIVIESTIFQKEYLFKLVQNHLILGRFFQEKKQQQNLQLSLSNILEDNYYHWTIESLTRVLLIENFVDLHQVTIVINDHKIFFKIESLTFLFKISEANIKAKPAKDVYAGHFILPSFTHTRNAATMMTDICHPSIIRLLNKKIVDGIFTQSNKPFPLMFILSRKKAANRKILNEEYLMNALDDKRFQIIETENLTFQDQVFLFFHGQIVIATHGAGLTNIIFSKRIKVIELFPKDRDPRDIICFTQISAALGFDHHIITYSSHNTGQDVIIDSYLAAQINTSISSR